MPTKVAAEYVLCRMFRSHAWEDFTPDRRTYRAPDWGRTFHFRCIRCATERHDTIDSLGELGARRYVYPDNYRLTAEETPTTQELRLFHMRELRARRRTKRGNAA